MKSMLLVLFIIGTAVAQVPMMQKCPDLKVMPNFEITKIFGKWYEAERFFHDFELAGRCVSVYYSASDKGAMNLVNKQYSAITGSESKTEGYAMQRQPEKAKLTIILPSSTRTETELWVLDTDYTSYAVVWSCTDIGDVMSSRWAWIITRERFPSKSVMDKAYAFLDKNGIDRKYFMKTDQENCPPGF